MSEFQLLATHAHVAYYQSCKITMVSLMNKKKNIFTNLFTKCLLQEAPFTVTKLTHEGELFNLTGDLNIAIVSYEIDMKEAESLYDDLAATGTWSETQTKHVVFEKGKTFPRKYTMPLEYLKDNDFLTKSANGSYWIEFFNEAKQSVDEIYHPANEELLIKAARHIEQVTGADLLSSRDRVGNIVFQFPVTLLTSQVKMTDEGKKLVVSFDWKVVNGKIPPVVLQTDSVEGNTTLDYSITEYNGKSTQEINITDSGYYLTLRIVRTDLNLILFSWQCDCPQITGIYGTFSPDEPVMRTFYIDNVSHQVQIDFPNTAFNPIHHAEHTKMAEYRKKSMDPANHNYRYFTDNQHQEAVRYIRSLITGNRGPEVMMFDPFLSSRDLLNFLYFSTLDNRKLRAIGGSNTETRQHQGSAATSLADYMTEQRIILSDPRHINSGLNLEFRVQYDKFSASWHDRFLFFPGTQDLPPAGYSIGTSFNAVGKSFHAVIELVNPQHLIDYFEYCWKRLADPACLIYKS